MTAYAELQITSNFSFLRGGSHPEELVLRAAALGLAAIALTDRNTLAGVVRAHVAAKEVGIRFVVGARLDLMSTKKADPSLSTEATTDSVVSPSGLTRQSIPQAGDIAPGRGMAARVKPGGDGKEVAPPRIWTLLPSSSPDTSDDFPINDLPTISASQSAPHAMVGIRAPAPGQPRRSDSHHSLRHDLSVPSLGKRGVNAATAVPTAEGYAASNSANVTTNFGQTALPPVAANCGQTALPPVAATLDQAAFPPLCPDARRGSATVAKLPSASCRSSTATPHAGHLTPDRDMDGVSSEVDEEEPGDDQKNSDAPGNKSENGTNEQRTSHPKSRKSNAAKGYSLLCFPTDRTAYGRLSQLISLGQRRALKGDCQLWLDDVLAHAEGMIFVVLPPERIDEEFEIFLERLRKTLRGPCYLAAQHLYRGDDALRIEALAELADACGTPLVATGDVLYHTPARRPLQDVLTCIREHCTIDEAGYLLEANAERHLKPGAEMARLFARYPDALARTLEIADACRFSLAELRYEYPIDPAPAGMSVQAYLEQLTWAGAAERYPDGLPDKVKSLLEHEFALIAELGYAPYFLTVHDIVRFAGSRGILCQGRGSAANSAVCYCLGITAVDPERFDLLFERFVSAERNEPPDIDVDFEHERREEVIQYIYAKYGRAHAGIAATVIHYRSRSAIREVGKALGLSEDAVGALASGIWGWSEGGLDARLAHERGLDPAAPRLRQALELAGELTGFPRHLSQHVGGFVLTRSRLDQVVPVVNAAMADRTMVEWDKDDLDALGILKIDVLALGMLTCVRKAFELLERYYGQKLDLATVPPEDPAVYDMLGRADSLGVFQVESRAQMTMLPRLQPRCFYDLVIEVAIVRPGPIQGDMVHPYLRRRSGLEPVSYPSEELRGVLEKTLGVPLFQEQAMQIAIVGAGFTPSESDRLRRAMATFKRVGTIHTFRDKFIEGMVANGYPREFAERCFKQIEGFGTYGFPESHAASFALLVYVSSWLKCHYPEVFACALLNSQPMGFYAPAQIVRDARDHGVTVLPVDVNASEWDCTLEPDPAAAPPGEGATSLPSWASPRSTYDCPVNDLPTINASQSTAHEMLGVRAPAPKQPRRSDSHHSPRHDLIVSGVGKQKVTVAPAISDIGPTKFKSSSARHPPSPGSAADHPTPRTSPGYAADQPAPRTFPGCAADQPAPRTSLGCEADQPAPRAIPIRRLMTSQDWHDAEAREAPRVASITATPNRTAGDSTRASMPPAGDAASDPVRDRRVLGSGPGMPGGDEAPAHVRDMDPRVCGSGPRMLGSSGASGDNEKALRGDKVRQWEGAEQPEGDGKASGSDQESVAPGDGEDASRDGQNLRSGEAGRNLTPSRPGSNENVASVASGSATAAADGIAGGHDARAVLAEKRALRLGFRQVKGLKQEDMERLVARRAGGYADLADLRRRAEIGASALDRLARADAFTSLTLDRRGAIWRAIGLDRTGRELDLPPLFAWAEGRTARPEPSVALPPMTLGQEVVEDYANLRLTLRRHPLALLRPWLGRRMVKAERLAEIDDGRRVEVAGLVLVRQRPGTASGVIFITIEDESGIANLVVWPTVFERFRRIVLGAQLMAVRGKVQKEGLVIHVVADTLIDRTDLLRRLAETDQEFEAPVARADRVKRPSDSGQRPPRRRSASSPPFEAPVARADHAKNSGPPDPRDPGHLSRRQRLLARLGKLEAPLEAPVARADEVKRNTRNVRELHPKAPGFKSRDFH